MVLYSFNAWSKVTLAMLILFPFSVEHLLASKLQNLLQNIAASGNKGAKKFSRVQSQCQFDLIMLKVYLLALIENKTSFYHLHGF